VPEANFRCARRHAKARPLELKSTFDGGVTLTCTHGALDQPGRMLRQFALYGVDPGLGALLVLVGRAAADADPTDLHLVCGHDWKTPGKRNDAGKIGYAGDYAGFPLFAKGQLAELASRKGKIGRGNSFMLGDLDTSKIRPSMRSNAIRFAPSSTIAMFIFQPSCFALASQAATIFFAISRLIAGLVSAAIPAELQMTRQVANAIGPRTRRNISISTSLC
jgi:hypothetical protein